ERRDERARVDGSWDARVRMEVGRFAPAVDAHGPEPSFVHELGDETLRNRLRAPAHALLSDPPRARWQPVLPAVHAEVAGEIDERPDPARSRAEEDELLHRLFARRHRRVERGARDHAIGDVVLPLETATAGDREQPGVEEMLERRLAGAPAPPVP